MGTADLHIHTARGDGMAEVPELLDYVQEHVALDVIAITEHDDIRAAQEARDAWARGRYPFDLIVGEEVTTTEGHVVALFIERNIEGLRPLAPTLEEIHRQGGLAIIPHPMSWLTRSVGQRTIERVLREDTPHVSFDAMERSGSPAARVTAKKAQRLNAARYHLPEVGGSDAHFLEAIGAAKTLFEGSTAEELRRAIVAGETRAELEGYPSMLDLGLLRVARQQWRGMRATPRQMGWLPTIGSFLRRVRP